MKLSAKEFDAMQMKWRKWYIEKVELRTFLKFASTSVTQRYWRWAAGTAMRPP